MIFSFMFGLVVKLDNSVESQINNFMKCADFIRESGGILIGRIEPLKNTIEITNMTYPQLNDKRSPFTFHRKQNGHQRIMDQLWQDSNFEKMYLGEWHTHSTAIPTPSTKDIREWRRRASMKNNSRHVVFLIIGKKESCLWTIYDGMMQKANGMIHCL